MPTSSIISRSIRAVVAADLQAPPPPKVEAPFHIGDNVKSATVCSEGPVTHSLTFDHAWPWIKDGIGGAILILFMVAAFALLSAIAPGQRPASATAIVTNSDNP